MSSFSPSTPGQTLLLKTHRISLGLPSSCQPGSRHVSTEVQIGNESSLGRASQLDHVSSPHHARSTPIDSEAVLQANGNTSLEVETVEPLNLSSLRTQREANQSTDAQIGNESALGRVSELDLEASRNDSRTTAKSESDSNTSRSRGSVKKQIGRIESFSF